MSIKFSFNHLIDLTKNDIVNSNANDDLKNKFLSIFNQINTLDKKEEENISYDDYHKLQCFEQKNKTLSFLDRSNDNELTDFEIESYYNETKEFWGNNIKLEDFKKFFSFLDKEYTKKEQDKEEKDINEIIAEKHYTKDFIKKVGIDNARDLIEFKKDNKTFYKLTRGYEDTYIEKIYDSQGNVVGENSQDEYIDPNTMKKYTATSSTRFEKNKVLTVDKNLSNNIETLTSLTLDDENNIKNTEIYTKKDSTIIKETKMGMNEFHDDVMETKLDGIILDAGKKTQMKINFKYDKNNKIVGLSSESIPQVAIIDTDLKYGYKPSVTISDSNIKLLNDLLNGGAKINQDFDLKVKNGKVEILPKIKNNTSKKAPELKGEALEEYKNLVTNGAHADEDFDIEYNEDGTFKYKYHNNQALGYNKTSKVGIFDKNGKLLQSLEVVDNEIKIITNKNGKKSIETMDLDNYLLQLAIEQKFDIILELIGSSSSLEGGYNLFSLADKYKESIGKELIIDIKNSKLKTKENLLYKLLPRCKVSPLDLNDEQLLKVYNKERNEFKKLDEHNVNNTVSSDLMPQIERSQISDNYFKEKVNDDSFEVRLDGEYISIEKNNEKSTNIKISHLPKEFVTNVVMKMNSLVLYDLGISQGKIIIDELLNRNHEHSTGKYNGMNVGKSVLIDPNVTTQKRMLQVISHEIGHMADKIDDLENAKKFFITKKRGELFNDKPIVIGDMIKEYGIFHPTSINNSELTETYNKELKYYQSLKLDIDDNNEYALNNVFELFAESYTLLTTGDCRSEYILTNYFPETLKVIKEQIESNRKFKENQN